MPQASAPSRPKFIYYVAASADGFIARLDGRVDWLDARPAGDYGAEEFMASIGTIVWGRRTFDQAATFGGLAPFGKVRHIVVSHRPAAASLEPHVEFTDAPPADLARRLRASARKDIWIMGGAELAGSFVAAAQVDELVVHVIPVLLGSGIPLMRGFQRDVGLRLLESHAFPDGVVRLRYAITDAAPATDRGDGT